MKNKTQMQTDILKDAKFTVDGLGDPDKDEVKIAGWAARYDTPFKKFEYRDYEFWRVHVDGCFADAIAGNPTVHLALNHEGAYAKTDAGTLSLTSVPGKGVYWEATVSKKNPEAMAMLVEMERGTLSEGSMAYLIPEDKQKIEITTTPEGRTIETQYIYGTELDHGDVSVCLYGSNPTTSAWVAAMPRDSRDRLLAMYPEGVYDTLPSSGEEEEVKPPDAADGEETPDKVFPTAHLHCQLRLLSWPH